MPLIDLRNISLSFGGPPLLDQINLQIENNERIALLGRNGSGKSTLLKLLLGELQADSGQIDRQQKLKIACLSQDVPDKKKILIYDEVASALGQIGQNLKAYQKLSVDIEHDASPEQLARLEKLTQAIDADDGWSIQHRIDSVLDQLGIDANQHFDEVSAGYRRRVMLAKALITEPDLLILDEPTNHLDLKSILWLEQSLSKLSTSLLFVSHDRSFIQNLSTRILEIDRGRLKSWKCDYASYLERKDAELEAESIHEKQFDKKLAQEEAWIRKGIKARRTRNEGRVRALERLREERKQRRDKMGSVNIRTQEAEKSGMKVINAKDICVAYDDKVIIDHFSTTVMRGDCIGIIGENGSGKTTLIKALLGQIPLKSGSVELGTNLQIAYFDQLHEQLDHDKTVFDNIAGGSQFISINGNKRHVITYLQDFLFSADRSKSPVSHLSGGEKKRLLLAKLFTKPSNLLILDEPTNDIDMETLELLEQTLLEYPGTKLIISHDRSFLNEVVGSTIVFEEKAKISEYIGGYDDWLRQRQEQGPVIEKSKVTKVVQQLSDEESKELRYLPRKIDKLEDEQKKIHAKMSEDGFYEKSQDHITKISQSLKQVEDELEGLYSRWEELEMKKEELRSSKS